MFTLMVRVWLVFLVTSNMHAMMVRPLPYMPKTTQAMRFLPVPRSSACRFSQQAQEIPQRISALDLERKANGYHERARWDRIAAIWSLSGSSFFGLVTKSILDYAAGQPSINIAFSEPTCLVLFTIPPALLTGAYSIVAFLESRENRKLSKKYQDLSEAELKVNNQIEEKIS